MGFWKSAGNFVSKQAERAMLIASGVQWGDSANDAEKISSTLAVYNQRALENEKQFQREESTSMQYTVFSLVIVVVLFIIVLGFRMLLEGVKNKQVQPQQIKLTTLREGNRTINANETV